MNSRFPWLSIASVAVTLAAQPSAAQSALPANLQSDRAAIQQDQAMVQDAERQLRADRVAGNAAAEAADRTALRIARMKSAEDFGVLLGDAQPILKPDRDAVLAALTQLHADQAAGNTNAVQADQAALAAAEGRLAADRQAIFGGLGRRFFGRRAPD
ncbi:MAG: hypothetical protein ACXWG3_09525 [Usitatibacter sp.]